VVFPLVLKNFFIMPKHCCWGQCPSDSRKSDPEVVFMAFPKPKTFPNKAKRWAQMCGRGKDFNVSNITKNTYICCKHFPPGAVLDLKRNPLLEPFNARKAVPVQPSRRRPPPPPPSPPDKRGKKEELRADAFGPGLKRYKAPSCSPLLASFSKPGWSATLDASSSIDMRMDEESRDTSRRRDDLTEDQVALIDIQVRICQIILVMCEASLLTRVT
jgi:hypothetical protein